MPRRHRSVGAYWCAPFIVWALIVGVVSSWPSADAVAQSGNSGTFGGNATPANAPATAGRTRDQLLQDAARAQTTGKSAEAITILTSVLGEQSLPNAQRANVLNDRAVAYARLGDYQKAFADFNASARLFPENAALYNNRAAVLLRLDMPEEALKDLDRAIRLSPNYGTAKVNRAIARKRMNRGIAALGDLRDVMRNDPKNGVALTARAQLYLDQGLPRAAIRDAALAISFNSKDARA